MYKFPPLHGARQFAARERDSYFHDLHIYPFCFHKLCYENNIDVYIKERIFKNFIIYELRCHILLKIFCEKFFVMNDENLFLSRCIYFTLMPTIINNHKLIVIVT